MVFTPLVLAVLLAGGLPASELRAGETAPETASAERVSLFVSPSTKLHDVQRIGMNLGIWTSWGAEQLGSNIIKNPGFEGLIDSGLSTIKSIQGTTVVLDGESVRRQDGFWNGASINFRTGSSAGKSSRIKEFHGGSGSRGLALLDSEMVAAPGDVVALRKIDDAAAPTQWWLSENEKGCLPGPPRPGSLGLRSLVLCSTASNRAEANSFLDGTTSRSGKLLPIRGKWRFSFWTRLLSGVPQLNVFFGRSGSKPFLAEKVVPTQGWRQIVIDFDATDEGPDGPLQLQFFTSGNGRIALDDASLSQTLNGTFPFRQEVVGALEVLRPGYLRDWQGQLGDSISNRLAAPFARRATRYRSQNLEDAQYEYSIPEFLELSRRLGASPWLVLPTTGSDEEYLELGTYLARIQKRMGFREILVEFGNENWNPMFSAAGIQDAKRHGEAAGRAFLYLRKGAGRQVPLQTVMNAQFANPSAVTILLKENVSDLVAVAPYFAYELAANADTSHTDLTLFATAQETFGQLEDTAVHNRAELAVYEVNLHTVGGSASSIERDDLVLSAEAGSALGKRLLEGLSSGVRRQCVYTLAGFDAYTANRTQFVQLWGVVRDLAGSPRLRSTGVAVSMVNQSVQEEMHEVVSRGSDPSRSLTAIAFKGRRGWSAAIVSERNQPVEVTLSFPALRGEPLPTTSLTLAGEMGNGPKGASPEYGRTIILHTSTESAVRISLPPRSLVVLVSERPATLPAIGIRR